MYPIKFNGYAGQISICQQYNVKVYLADEPLYTADSMQVLVNAVHQAGGVLWADDYNEQVEVIGGIVIHEHLANSTALNAADVVGTDMYEQTAVIAGVSYHYITCSDVITEYENFSSLFGQKFQFAWEEYDANYDCFTSAFSYLATHNMNACGLYCAGEQNGWNTSVPSDWSHVDAFCQNAENAGFLDRVDQLYNQTYVCQQNGVRFTPMFWTDRSAKSRTQFRRTCAARHFSRHSRSVISRSMTFPAASKSPRPISRTRTIGKFTTSCSPSS